MNLSEIVRGRRSIRKYEDREIPVELLKEILDDAVWAPSGTNRQNWEIVVVRGARKDGLLKLIDAAAVFVKPRLEKYLSGKMVNITLQFFKNLGGAPVILLVYIPKAKYEIRDGMSNLEKFRAEHGRFTDICSASALTQNILLLAKAKGLGTCWMTAPKYVEDEIGEFLGITDRELVSVIPIGYPAQDPPAPPRKGDKIKWIGFEQEP